MYCRMMFVEQDASNMGMGTGFPTQQMMPYSEMPNNMYSQQLMPNQNMPSNMYPQQFMPNQTMVKKGLKKGYAPCPP